MTCSKSYSNIYGSPSLMFLSHRASCHLATPGASAKAYYRVAEKAHSRKLVVASPATNLPVDGGLSSGTTCSYCLLPGYSHTCCEDLWQSVTGCCSRRRIVLLGTPLASTALLFFHPSPYDDVAGELMPIASWWIALHTIGFLLFALMGVALWLLTAGLRGVFVTVSRVAAVVFALFYDAGDAIAGISTGILARSAEAGVLGERAAVGAIQTLWVDPFKNLLFDIGRDAFIVALVTAAVALW